MNIGIVTTWFERGAAHVSRQFVDILKEKHNIFVYARGGENYAKNNPEWDLEYVHWGKVITSPFVITLIDKSDFSFWIEKKNIQLVIFNEQHWWLPVIWCNALGIKTLAYIDYYTNQTLPFFKIYDGLICNTKRHYSLFEKFGNAHYLPWGTSISLYKPQKENIELVDDQKIIFFHSAGMAPFRKGTDLLLKSFEAAKINSKLIIHTQVNLASVFPQLKNLIDHLLLESRLEIIEKTVPAPGLYKEGDIYVYPSRLDGIGLTITEALSSGLGILVPDNAPMNEFVNKDTGLTLKIDKYYSREDGYYWPLCEICEKDLTNKLEFLAENRNEVLRLKINSRTYSEKSLDWNKNKGTLLSIIDMTANKENNASLIISQIIKFENTGVRKLNISYIKYFKIIKLLLYLNKKFKSLSTNTN